MRAIAILVIVLLLSPFAHAQPQPDLWFYYPMNLLPDQNIDKLEQLWRRAAQAGYNHVLLADSKFMRLQDMPKSYFRNCERVKRLPRNSTSRSCPPSSTSGIRTTC